MVSREISAPFQAPVGHTEDPPQVTVVVAAIDAASTIGDCLRSLSASLAGTNSQLIVADGSRDGTAAIVAKDFPDVSLIRMPAGTLAPRLWATGLTHFRGRRIAFITGHSSVSSGWNRALTDALAAGSAGAGGPLVLSRKSSLTDAAIYFLRYSAFMPSAADAPHVVDEIAGDNAMYRGDLIRRYIESFANGFWEVAFHEILRSEGQSLMMVPAAEVDFGQSFSLRAISAQRFSHGRHFGRWRVSTRRSSKARIIAGAPAVPLVLVARIARRVFAAVRRPVRGNGSQPDSGGRRSLPARFVSAAPVIFWLAICWAFGEAAGAWEA